MKQEYAQSRRDGRVWRKKGLKIGRIVEKGSLWEVLGIVEHRKAMEVLYGRTAIKRLLRRRGGDRMRETHVRPYREGEREEYWTAREKEYGKAAKPALEKYLIGYGGGGGGGGGGWGEGGPMGIRRERPRYGGNSYGRPEKGKERDTVELQLAEGRRSYSPVRKRQSKAGRTNNFGLKSNRWYEVRKGGGWVGKYGKVAEGREKGIRTRREKDEKTREGRVEKKHRKEVEKVRREEGSGSSTAAPLGIERQSQTEQSRRRGGPVSRAGVRQRGKERQENGRPVEKRVRRSRGETRSVRGREVRSRTPRKGRLERERSLKEDREKNSGEERRETREARKRYIGERTPKKTKEERRKKEKRRRAMEARERGESEEDGRSKGERLGVSEAKGRKGRRERQKREEKGERRNWGRKGIGRDGLGVGKRSVRRLLGVWRNKEKRVVEKEMVGVRSIGGKEGKQGRRREEVEARERRERKGYRGRGRKERVERRERKERERELKNV